MKINSSRHIALVSALISYFFILSIILYLDRSNVVFVVAAPIITGILVYVITATLIKRFIFDKIKAIYRIIYGKADGKQRAQPVLDEVLLQAEKWESTRQVEITNLKQQAQYRREFVGNLAHELRTPLFSIQGYIDTLLEGGLEDPKINYDYLSRADKNLERLTVLVKDLSAIADIESNQETMEFGKLNIVSTVEEVFSLLELRAKKKKVSLNFNKNYERAIMVTANKDKILQVITNLVMNAIHYSNKNGHCTIEISDAPNHILIEVKDDGIGIATEHLPRLFERFYRVDKSRSRNDGGTGLGLAIVKHLLESHGQTINVHSELGVGTTFSFTLLKA
jgi:two-component system phosphate regulon sensor histidine kinase PhoR